MERGALATFVATIEAQREDRQAARAAGWKREHGFGALLVSGLTLFTVAVAGYHPYAEDGGLYVAGVKRLLDPALYPRATEFVLEPMRWSVFAPAVAGMVRMSHLGLPTVLLVLHLASVWATLFAAWMLAGRCFEARGARVGAVALLACWMSLPVAGTALLLMDPYVTARSFSTPCMVLALVGALDMTECGQPRRRGFLLWGGSMLLAGAMHPLMAAYALGATAVLVCVRSSRRRVRTWGTAAMCAAAVGVAACLQAMVRPESADYVRVALTRTYWFPMEWRWFELVGLAAPLAILVLYAGTRGSRTHISDARCGAPAFVAVADARSALARMAVVVGATAWVVAMLFARTGAATHLVARLQPLRAFQVVYLVMVMMLGARLGERMLRRSAWRWCAAALLLGGVMFAAARGAFPSSNHLELPGRTARNAWVQAFVWIRENTAKDAMFALDADYINARGEDAQCFRAIAERSALPDYSKDGGEASIAPELTDAWEGGQAAQSGLSAMTDMERLRAFEPLGVTWVVVDSRAGTGLSCPYANDSVKVCRLR
jgi:hypothetical protein